MAIKTILFRSLKRRRNRVLPKHRAAMSQIHRIKSARRFKGQIIIHLLRKRRIPPTIPTREFIRPDSNNSSSKHRISHRAIPEESRRPHPRRSRLLRRHLSRNKLDIIRRLLSSIRKTMTRTRLIRRLPSAQITMSRTRIILRRPNGRKTSTRIRIIRRRPTTTIIITTIILHPARNNPTNGMGETGGIDFIHPICATPRGEISRGVFAFTTFLRGAKSARGNLASSVRKNERTCRRQIVAHGSSMHPVPNASRPIPDNSWPRPILARHRIRYYPTCQSAPADAGARNDFLSKIMGALALPRQNFANPPRRIEKKPAGCLCDGRIVLRAKFADRPHHGRSARRGARRRRGMWD